MANYTWEFGELREQWDGWEDAGLERVKWDESLEYLYALKDDIIERFNEWYEFHEIGAETPWRWQKLVQRHYDANKVVWNHLIELYALNDTSALHSINRITRDIQQKNALNAVKDRATTSATDRKLDAVTDRDTTENTSTDVSQDTTTTNTYSDTTKEYDTPVTQTGSLNNGYLSGGTGTDSSSSEKEATEYDSTVARTRGDDITYGSTESTGTEGSFKQTDDTTETRDRNEVHDYEFYSKTPIELINENVSEFEDVIQDIVLSCNTLFINELTKV